MENSYNEADNVRGGLYFAANSNDEIVIKTKHGIHAKYFLNRKELFEYSLAPDDNVIKISLRNYNYYSNGNEVQLIIYSATRWHDTKRFMDEDERNGLVGKFIWATPKKKKSIFKHKFVKGSKAGNATYTEAEDDDESENTAKRDGGEFFFQIVGGANIGLGSGGSINSKLKHDYPEAWEINPDWADTSVTLISGYVAAMISYEFMRNFAIGFGAGMACMNAEIAEPDEYYNYYSKKPESIDLGQSYAPLVQAEISFGEEWNFGVRETFIFDSKWKTNYLGGFVELGNLLGLEIGWNHSDGFWDALYLGLYLKIPPRHFSEFVEKKLKK